jgi:hypothetical protein
VAELIVALKATMEMQKLAASALGKLGASGRPLIQTAFRETKPQIRQYP